MRRKVTPDFWRAAWARRVAAIADSEGVDQAHAMLTSDNWLGAIRQARAGDWAWLDDLVERVGGDADEWEFAPPPDTWAVLDEFFASAPLRTRGPKRRKDRTVAEAIRRQFAHLTARPGVVVDEGDNVVGFKPPMTDDAARKYLASMYALSDETVRDIVERRKTYLADQ